MRPLPKTPFLSISLVAARTRSALPASAGLAHRGDSYRGRRRFSSETRSGRYYRARYYHPGLQRFISEDPVGLLGGDLNFYAYAGNSPIRFIDPLGLDRQTPFISDEPGLEEPWLLDPTILIGGLPGLPGKALGKIGARVAPKLWAAPGAGRVVINGIEYTTHALERMAPVGMIQKGTEVVSRGVPPSVVEHAIQYGTKAAGNELGTIVHVFQNVTVVTNSAANRVITVIKTGR